MQRPPTIEQLSILFVCEFLMHSDGLMCQLVYSRAKSEWTRCPDLPTPRFGFACGVCADDPVTRSEEVWVIGGWFGSQYLDVVEVGKMLGVQQKPLIA